MQWKMPHVYPKGLGCMNAKAGCVTIVCTNWCVQFGVQRIAIVECTTQDDATWRERIEQRGKEEANGERSHKPCHWDELQTLMRRSADLR